MKDIKNVTIYVIEGCPFCAAALAWLDSNNVVYDKIVMPGDKEKRTTLDEFTQYFPEDPRGVPIIVVTTKDDQKHYYNDETDPSLQKLVL